MTVEPEPNVVDEFDVKDTDILESGQPANQQPEEASIDDGTSSGDDAMAGGGTTVVLPTQLGLRALFRAKQSVGVREVPLNSNWGPSVKIYLASVGITFPAPWCMAFVHYKLHQAAQELGIALQWPRTGSCTVVGNWADDNARFLDAPEPGCVFLIWSEAKQRYIHTGFVAEVLGPDRIATVEGNSNDNGSSEGIGVFAIHRHTTNLDFVAVR